MSSASREVKRLRVCIEAQLEADAGELIDGDEVMAELFESVGLPALEPFNEHRRKSRK